MRALQRCDFCEADAVGTFEAIPSTLEPEPHEQRRVVLCEECKRRLETIIEPLVARTSADTSERDRRTQRPLESAGSPDGSSGSIVASADGSTEKRPRDRSPNASVSDSRTEDPADSGATGEVTFDVDDEPDSDDADDAAEPLGEQPTEQNATESAPEPSSDDGPHSSETSEDTTESAGRSPTADTDPDATSAPPRAYGKVVRLLRNREFPMERTAVEKLAAGAYDLEAETAERIVDAALENGEFEERGGNLYRA
ncbi:hypothetical protein [Natrarchaeobaculum sulfurireducens]|uniref:HNH/McrA nuclease domain containing protein n=1 Tax=Natrarchaeobaculum sulfurireducens TaxID=2044521 RepID=A0A346PLK4_9EURY|nr:hypothetical protein [Natrarchaeobaculum sulfurireducens]AXR76728.1 HNH/McrA nuclease domain containing protein [Natrarchaeobaculum sulfurireducens]AXR80399.1 hypothetical protein AArcMg_0376 [Natrarchaeobaculum sulfurireducens]